MPTELPEGQLGTVTLDIEAAKALRDELIAAIDAAGGSPAATAAVAAGVAPAGAPKTVSIKMGKGAAKHLNEAFKKGPITADCIKRLNICGG